MKCIEKETSQAQPAGDIGITKSYVSHVIKKRESMVSEIFVQMTAALRYGIKLTYVKRTNVKGTLLWAARLQEKSIL